MRDVFSKTVKDERVSVHEGAFDRTGAPDASTDLIVIAQVRRAYRRSPMIYTAPETRTCLFEGISLVPRL